MIYYRVQRFHQDGLYCAEYEGPQDKAEYFYARWCKESCARRVILSVEDASKVGAEQWRQVASCTFTPSEGDTQA